MFMLSCVFPLPLCFFFFFLVGEGEACTEVVSAVQETFPPLRHYFTSSLFMCTPLCSLTKEFWGKLNSLDTERQIVDRTGKREWMTKFLIFKLSQARIPSGASWHSSCYFSPGSSFLLTGQLYSLFDVSSRRGRKSSGNSWCLHQTLSGVRSVRELELGSGAA